LTLSEFEHFIELSIECLFDFDDNVLHEDNLIFFGVVGEELEGGVEKEPDLIFWDLLDLLGWFLGGLLLFFFFCFVLFFVLFLIECCENEWLENTGIYYIFIFVKLYIYYLFTVSFLYLFQLIFSEIHY
jgi:hypothetical protein